MTTGAGGFFEGFSSSYEIESTLPQNVSSESESWIPTQVFRSAVRARVPCLPQQIVGFPVYGTQATALLWGWTLAL